MELKDMLDAVRNDRIEFATMRPPGSQFATLERRVIVTGPPELITLSKTGDLTALDELVKLLKERDRAWAAMVLLAAMTRREEKIVDTFAATPGEWWDSVGKTAHERWDAWLKETNGKLVWDSANKVFVEKE
jgi:hypothetical protein